MGATGLLSVLRRRLLALILCLAAGAGGAVLLTARTTEVYEATARVFVNVPSASTVQNGVQGVQLTSELLPSYAEIATSRSVAQRIKDRLSLPESAEQLRKKLSADAQPQTLIIDISAQDQDPVRARSIADAATLALRDAVAELEQGREPGVAVQVRTIDDAITPRHPVEPRPTYNLVLGLLLGLAAGVVLALVLDALDRTVKTPAQAEAALGAPVLGVLPRAKRRAKQIVIDGADPSAEAFRALRTAVRFVDPDRPLEVLAVTSPTEGDGKTRTAVNLAVALAQSGERVVLVDGDLRRASVARLLGLEGSVGLTSVITKAVSLDDALQRWNDLLDVLPSGTLPPNPSEILGSQSMRTLLDTLRERATIVVVDAPPVIPVTDAVVLSTQVDGVLLVTRSGRTHRGLAAETRRRLDGVGAQVVGCVLNGVSTSSPQGYYATYHPVRTG